MTERDTPERGGQEQAKQEILRLLFEILQTRCSTGDICTCGRVTERIEQIEQLAADYFGIRQEGHSFEASRD